MASPSGGDVNPDPTRPESAPAAPVAPPLDRIRTVAHLLDDAFRIPGTDVRFGLDPVLGVLPVAGDAVSTLFSLYIVLEAARAGLPRPTLAKMLAVVAVDAVVGSVPLVGPLFDAAWKANRWNVATLERHLGGVSSGGEQVPRGPRI